MDDDVWSDGASEAAADALDARARVDALRAPVLGICAALGGYEDVDVGGRIAHVYRLGDDCLECLRDLRRLWRQDEDDELRTVARVFAELGVLHNDLVPIVLHAPADERGTRAALASLDLMTALTWPIDWAAEVRGAVAREADGDVLACADALRAAQAQYKASIVRARAAEARLAGRSVLGVVMELLVPALARAPAERTPRDVGVASMCLYLVRNLVAIEDGAPAAPSVDAQAQATVQPALIEALHTHHVLDAVLMLATHADTREFDVWGAVVAEIVAGLFLGLDARALARPAHAPLAAALHAEARARAPPLAGARHSRFGTAIQFRTHDGALRNAHAPRALFAPRARLEAAAAAHTRRTVRRRRAFGERGARAPHALEGRAAELLRAWAARFLDGGFAVLLRAYLRDIHAERERVGDVDAARVRALALADFFLAFFVAARPRWAFAAVADWLEPWAFRLVRARTDAARDARDWLEFTAALRLWTTLLRLVEALIAGSPADAAAADALQETLYYDGDLLASAVHAMHAYSAQSIACLAAVVDFAHIQPRLLERHAAAHAHMFVRVGTDTGTREREFRFAAFQRAAATARLAHAALQLLPRWAEAPDPRAALTHSLAVLHRIVVKAQRVELVFPARHTLAAVADDGLRDVAGVSASAARDLRRLAAYVEKRFAQLPADAQAAFNDGRRPRAAPPTELVVRPGFMHSEQIGIAIGLLAAQHRLGAVAWAKFALEAASAARKAGDAHDEPAPHVLHTDDLALRDDATRLPALKLFLRVIGLVADDSHVPWTWMVPRDRSPSALDRDAAIIEQYLAQPIAVDVHAAVRGKRAKEERQPEQPEALGGGADADLDDDLDGADADLDDDLDDERRSPPTPQPSTREMPLPQWPSPSAASPAHRGGLFFDSDDDM